MWEWLRLPGKVIRVISGRKIGVTIRSLGLYLEMIGYYLSILGKGVL